MNATNKKQTKAKCKATSVYLEDNYKEQLKKISKQTGLSAQDLMRTAVKNFLFNNEASNKIVIHYEN